MRIRSLLAPVLRMSSRRLLSALVAGFALVTAACATEADDPVTAEGSTTTTAATDDGGAAEVDPIDWDDCGAVECATIEVPLDHSEPDGEQIELYLARSPASGERKGATPMTRLRSTLVSLALAATLLLINIATALADGTLPPYPR